MRNAAFGAFAEAEQLARDLTWSPEAVDSAEVLFQVPPDHFRSRRTFAGPWPGAEKVPLECFQPEKEERIFVLGGCADVSREAAAALLRPVNQMALGARIGQAAAALAAREPKLEGIRVAGKPSASARPGVIREVAIEQNHRAEGTAHGREHLRHSGGGRIRRGGGRRRNRRGARRALPRDDRAPGPC